MDLLTTGAASLGIHLSDGQVEKFERYYQTLTEWNERVNLTSIVENEEVQRRLFLESLTVTQAIPGDILATGRLADVGTTRSPGDLRHCEESIVEGLRRRLLRERTARVEQSKTRIGK